VRYAGARRRMPRGLVRWVYDFEGRIEEAVREFAAELGPGARVLDAGAGEGQYRFAFVRQRYTGIDLGIGDAGWNYSGLDVVGDLGALPFAGDSFEAALNVVTLEHLAEPGRALAELARVLRPGGRLLLVAPQEWEVHQSPHDYFRYTRHGLEHLLMQAGLRVERMEAAGGIFRLLGRRLLNAWQAAPGVVWKLLLAPVFLPLGLVVPILDFLDRRRDFTLGYTCIARKP